MAEERLTEWTQKSGFQKATCTVCYGQAGTMFKERPTELDHSAVARMDTKEQLSATYRTRAWCRR